MDDLIPTPQPTSGGGNTTIPLFLALYLLILAFFILLVSISTLEEVKQKAAINSVTATFTNIMPPTTEITAFSSEEGDVQAGQAFQEKITGIFATSLRVAKVEIIQPGRLMRVHIPTGAMFFEGKAEIRPAQNPLLDRIVTTLSERAPGLRHDMEFVIGSRYTGGRSLPIGQTLEMSRTGVFARELSSRGAPPDSISIGIKAGDPEEISLWFYTRSIEETLLKFDTAKEAKEEAKKKPPEEAKKKPPEEAKKEVKEKDKDVNKNESKVEENGPTPLVAPK